MNKVARRGPGLTLWATFSMALFTSAATAGPESTAAPAGFTRASANAHSMPMEAGLQSLMEHLTGTYNSIRNARDSIVFSPARMARDLHDRTLAEDMRQNVLVPTVREQLDSLLRAAGDSLSVHDLQSANSSLTEVATILQREGETYDAIAAYWKRRGSQRPNRGPYLNHLRRNGLEPRYSKEIEAAEGSFEQQIEARQFIEAMDATFPLLQQLYEKASEEEGVQIHAAMKRGDFVPFRTQEGNVKCPRATRKTSGSPQPRVVSSLAVDDYYPAVSRRLGEEGHVLTDVLVSRNGCPVRAYVTVSSGYERLDAAALNYALHVSYRPAEIDRHTVTARTAFIVKFELAEQRAALSD